MTKLRTLVLLAVGGLLFASAAIAVSSASVDPIATATSAPLSDFASMLDRPLFDSPSSNESENEALKAANAANALNQSGNKPRGWRQPAPDQKPTNKNAKKDDKNNKKNVPAGILVRRATVAAAVARGIRPSTARVTPTEDRPGGLIVYGWQAAGAGLLDGDIITRVAGREPHCVEDVINAVIGAYKHQPASISGRVWRDGREINVTVLLPTVDDANQKSEKTPSKSTNNPPRTKRQRTKITTQKK